MTSNPNPPAPSGKPQDKDKPQRLDNAVHGQFDEQLSKDNLSTNPVPMSNLPRKSFEHLPSVTETLANSLTIKELQELQAERERSMEMVAQAVADCHSTAKESAEQASVITVKLDTGTHWAKHFVPIASALTALAAVLITSYVGWQAASLKASNAELIKQNRSLIAESEQVRQELRGSEIFRAELISSNSRRREQLDQIEVFLDEVFAFLRDPKIRTAAETQETKDRLLDQCLPVLESLIANIPSDSDSLPVKLEALSELAKSYRKRGNGSASARILTQMVKTARERVLIKNGSDASRNNLLLLLTQLAEVQGDIVRDLPASIRTFRETVEIAESMALAPKSDPSGRGKYHPDTSLAILAEVNQNLGTALHRMGRSQDAVVYLERANTIRAQLRSKISDRSIFANANELANKPGDKELSDVKRKLENGDLLRRIVMARILFQAGQTEDAMREFKDSLDFAERRLAQNPDNEFAIRRTLGVYSNLAQTQSEMGMDKEAAKIALRAVKLGEQLLGRETVTAEHKANAASVFYLYAQITATSDQATSIAYGEKSLRLRRELAATDPRNDRHQMLQMLSEARFGDVDEALKIANRYYDSEYQDSEMLVRVARAFAICSERLPSKADSLLDQGTRATERAIQFGWKDMVVLAHCHDLQPLQSRPAYAALVSSMTRTAADSNTSRF